MADTFTPHYNLTKPQIGGDPDTWGDLLNANFDLIDTGMNAAQVLAAGALPAAGGTVTGTLVIRPASGSPFLQLNKVAAGINNIIQGTTNGVGRWQIVPGDSTAESGSNAGSNFLLAAYNDAGAFLGSALTITRSSLAAAFGGTLSANGSFSSSTTTAVLASTGAGTVSLRPNGAASATGQLSVNSAGSVTTSGGITVTGGGVASAQVVQAASFSAVGGTSGYVFPDRTGGISWTWYATGGQARLNAASFGDTVSINQSTGQWTFGADAFAPDFHATSDIRLKSDILALRRGLDELKRMAPIEYTKRNKREAGFSAQEVQRVLPEAVEAGEDGYLTVSPMQILALVASAVLDLDKRLELAGI